MTYTAVIKREIKSLVRESVREALGVEFTKLRATLTPLVSEKEQKDIERCYKKPSRRTARAYAVHV